jgi:oxygen-independent coproporphyrinogen-3 oxidase
VTGFGIYLHVPFCRRRCDYCDFATWTDRTHLAERYLRACRRQAGQAAPDLPPVTSVFVGGGTPSLVDPASLLAVLEPLPMVDAAEVTIECNPDDVTLDLLRTYGDGGVTRISMGVQSMVPHVLAALGRTHDPASVLRAVDAAHSLDLDLNLDLIYGVAGETEADWERSLDEAIGLEPDHISAYALTVEPGTPLAADPSRHPDDDDQADKYRIADERLGAAGFSWYEISNWAKPGHACRHNLLYWSQGEYLGIGCAAHSHRDGRRFWNLRTPDRYVDAIEHGRSAEAADERLDADGRRIEGLQLSLRTADGVPADAFADEDLELLDGLVEVDADRARLTRSGRLLANEVAVHLR